MAVPNKAQNKAQTVFLVAHEQFYIDLRIAVGVAVVVVVVVFVIIVIVRC